MPNTKIIATLGPATDSEKILARLVNNGLAVARFNLSHGSFDDHRRRIDLVRKVSKKLKKKIGLLLDLEGHRIRIGKLSKKGITLEVGEKTILSNSGGGIPFDYYGSFSVFKKGQQVFIDDGNIILEILDIKKGRLKLGVVRGGLVSSSKGINIPEARLDFPEFNQNDEDGIRFGISEDVDYIAQSFIRSVSDVKAVFLRLGKSADKIEVISKIETREAIKNIDKIISVSDGIMVARGDMGISVPIYQVPLIQKKIIQKCNKANKFVITATQMLESMVSHSMPTRAEVSDVANAVIDGTDYVMLSAETAVGKYPIEVVRMMKSIIDYTGKNVNVIEASRK